ncbi:MAG: hypothetical protein K5925_01155 [Bacilli bacterium]|nr:hypothetical protein [Bacilli bacterium]
MNYVDKIANDKLFYIKKEDNAKLLETKDKSGHFNICKIHFGDEQIIDCRICGLCKDNGVYAIKIHYGDNGLARVGLFLIKEDSQIVELTCSEEQKEEVSSYDSLISEGSVSFFVVGNEDVAVLLAYNIVKNEYKAYPYRLPRSMVGKNVILDIKDDELK